MTWTRSRRFSRRSDMAGTDRRATTFGRSMVIGRSRDKSWVLAMLAPKRGLRVAPVPPLRAGFDTAAPNHRNDARSERRNRCLDRTKEQAKGKHHRLAGTVCRSIQSLTQPWVRQQTPHTQKFGHSPPNPATPQRVNGSATTKAWGWRHDRLARGGTRSLLLTRTRVELYQRVQCPNTRATACQRLFLTGPHGNASALPHAPPPRTPPSPPPYLTQPARTTAPARAANQTLTEGT